MIINCTKRLLFLTIACTLVAFQSTGQNSANYSFLTNSGGSLSLDKNSNTVDMSTGTTQIYGANADFPYTAVLQNIGFTFYFMGEPYTNFSVNPDGQLRFGSNLMIGQQQIFALNEPKLFPMNYEGKTNATGKVHYKVHGTSPNAVLVVEWKNILIPSTGTSNTTASTFQVRLYENGGVIEYVYGTMSNTFSSAITYIIGFASSNASGTIGQVANVTTTPAYNSTSSVSVFNSFPANGAMTNLSSAADGSRRVFRFTPPSASAPTNLVLSNVTPSSTTLTWTDNASNELGYKIYRSTDGVNYTLVSTLAPNTTTSVQTGLAQATNYFWKVLAYTEGSLSGFVSANATTTTCTIPAGIKRIPGDYPSLTAAVTALQTNGILGPVILELQSTFPATTETLPITLGMVPCASAVNTITIRPAPGVINTGFTSFNPTSTIDINNGKYWILDGRSGGTGTVSNLTFSNGSGSTGSSALKFSNSASDNIIRYVNFSGTGSAANTGVISFIGSPTESSSNNLIENCTIDGNAGSTVSPTGNVARNGIYSLGNALAQHSNNTVSNCKIFNWFVASSSSTSSGIFLSSGNTDWTITGNSFYQTSPRISGSGTSPLIPINLSSSSGNNFSITNNYIGGRSPLCGGSAWTQSGADNQLIGIYLSVGLSSSSSIQGNKIANLNISSTYYEPFYGIFVDDGMANIGNVTGNEIGSSFGTGSITVQSGNVTSSGATSRGIAYFPGTYTVTTISNNKIGSIICSGTSSAAFHNFFGIHVFTSTATISNNLIGGENTPNSIYLTNTASTAFNQQMAGILSITSTVYTTISNNIVANLRNAFTPASATFSSIRGIGVLGMSFVIDNVVRDLYASSNATGTGTNASVNGIHYLVTASGLSKISGNKIYALANSNSSGAVAINGIYYQGPSSVGTIERNLIHSLSASSPAATISGIFAGGGIGLYQNNMIRLGIDTLGNNLTTPCTINGILDSLDRSNYFHNTVYIGGFGVTNSASNTFAFKSYITTLSRDYRNNIFINDRSNAGLGGKHYAIQVGGTGVNPAGLVLNSNIYSFSGNGGVFGRYNSTDVFDFTSWRIALGQDAQSRTDNPYLVDPAAGFPDLHLSVGPPFGPGCSAEGTGTNVSVSEDFDGELRANLTPFDIGADAGNYSKPVYLGNYPDTNMIVGESIVISQDSFPAGVYRLLATAYPDFNGVISADPFWGNITIMNASPAGVYEISVWANDSLIRTFTLTVNDPKCNQGSFVNANSVSAGTSPFALAIGDFNMDDKQDIASASGNAVNIRLGNGIGGFAVTSNINLSSNPQAITIGDVNGDGNEDIVTGNAGPPYVSVLLGTGTGGFVVTNFTLGNSNSGSIILADYDNNGTLDIITVSTGGVYVLSGDGLGNFSLINTISSGGAVFSGITVSDFNNDGMIDLAILNRSSSTVLIRLGNGSGGFTGSTSVSVGSTPYYLTTGDFNNDNIIDIATSNSVSNSVSVRFGNGLGGFSGTTEVFMASTPYGLRAFDINGDSNLDLVCVNNGSSNVAIRYGNGLGVFSGTGYISVSTGPRSICIGDFNRDSIPDFAVSSASQNVFSVRLGVVNDINVQYNNQNIPDGSTTVSSVTGTDFGNVQIGSSNSKIFTIQNTNNNALAVNSINVSGFHAGDFLVSAILLPDSLYAGNSRTFTVSFVPSASGYRSAVIHINSNDCDEADYDFLIQGFGFYNCNGNISDNDACTDDACNSLTGISHTLVNPDDGNSCTLDGCNSVTGVFHNPVTEVCGNGIDDDCDGLIDENCDIVLNLNVFIQGFYLGNSTMKATIDSVAYPMLCDTIRIELHSSSSPFQIQFADTGLINTLGLGSFSFPYSAFRGDYYIVARHRNALETWSSVPVSFNGQIINYSFTNSQTNAYGNNLYDLGDGNFALWSGDISNDVTNTYGVQDGFIQFRDYNYMEQNVFVTSLGYSPADLSGDHVVESLDYMFEENAYFYLLVSMHP